MEPRSSSALPDGLVDLPADRIAAVATYLEMGRPAGGAEPDAIAACFSPIGADLPRYRAIYAAVGEPWMWFSRAAMPDRDLRAILSDPDVAAAALTVEGRDIGLVELDFRADGQCELAFFGLVPGVFGQGLGRRALAEAIRRAFLRPISRLWVHTCTLDHPAALPLYVKAGFRPYRRVVEVAPDPRLSGHMPEGAGPLFPVIRPS